MKRIVLVAALFAITATVFGQATTEISSGKKLTANQIYNLLNKACKVNGITEPDKLAIGEGFVIPFSDETQTTLYAKEGDTRSGLAEQAAKMQTETKVILPAISFVPKNTMSMNATPPPGGNPEANSAAGAFGNWFSVLFATLVMGALVVFLYRQRRIPENVGPAMTPGGITQENVEEVMHAAAERSFPNNVANIQILRIDEGLLNTDGRKVLIDYNDEPRLNVLKDRPGIRATVRVGEDPNERVVYSLLKCGNDVRVGRGLSEEGIRFTLTAHPTAITREVTAPQQAAVAATSSVQPAATKPSFEACMTVLADVLNVPTGNQCLELKLTSETGAVFEVKLFNNSPVPGKTNMQPGTHASVEHELH